VNPLFTVVRNMPARDPVYRPAHPLGPLTCGVAMSRGQSGHIRYARPNALSSASRVVLPEVCLELPVSALLADSLAASVVPEMSSRQTG
jgi:hypothetical protein